MTSGSSMLAIPPQPSLAANVRRAVAVRGLELVAHLPSDHPECVTAILMHGVPQLTAAESSDHPSLHPKPRVPVADGSRLSGSFQPRTPPDPPAILAARTWMTITGYVSSPNLAHWAVFHHDMRPDLMALRGPGLILSDATDPLHPIDLRVATMRPDFEYLEFSQGSIFAFMTNPSAGRESPLTSRAK